MNVRYEELRQARVEFSSFRNGWIIKRYTPKLSNSSGTVIEALNECLSNYDRMVGKINKLMIETDSYVYTAYDNLKEADASSTLQVQ